MRPARKNACTTNPWSSSRRRPFRNRNAGASNNARRNNLCGASRLNGRHSRSARGGSPGTRRAGRPCRGRPPCRARCRRRRQAIRTDARAPRAPPVIVVGEEHILAPGQLDPHVARTPRPARPRDPLQSHATCSASAARRAVRRAVIDEHELTARGQRLPEQRLQQTADVRAGVVHGHHNGHLDHRRPDYPNAPEQRAQAGARSPVSARRPAPGRAPHAHGDDHEQRRDDPTAATSA